MFLDTTEVMLHVVPFLLKYLKFTLYYTTWRHVRKKLNGHHVNYVTNNNKCEVVAEETSGKLTI